TAARRRRGRAGSRGRRRPRGGRLRGGSRPGPCSGSVRVVRLSEIMTSGVVTAGAEASALEVARLMRDHRRVGSVVVVDSAGKPVAMMTDRDLALRVFAEGVEPATPALQHA